MLRSLLARAGLIRDPGQLELAFDASGTLLARLQRLGMRGVTSLTLTRNRAVYVSFRGTGLRVHEAFVAAPEEVLRAIVVFVCGRGAARAAARRLILAFPVPRGERARRTRERLHPDDRPLADQLTRAHAQLNAERFAGALRPIQVHVSRRMRTRLGHYAPAATHGTAQIAVSRRHVRRHGWDEALDTLLHEMVHQWQDESGLPVDHGAAFRRKAREVGAQPRAKRVVTR
ncbi:MAG: SprT-like domain-containing protein [Gemmatimonadaceae bacterium]|nr:SprT-like domain-containing protein [Gemmatimonadaceae bacterium]